MAAGDSSQGILHIALGPSQTGAAPTPFSKSAQQSPLLDQQKRRSSSRSIKRKKFDDELVESSLVKSSRPRPQSISLPPTGAPPTPTPPAALSAGAGPSGVGAGEGMAAMGMERKKSRPSQKRSKKQKVSHSHSAKEVCRWKPADDLMLILSLEHSKDLETVYRGVKFSSKFTLREVQERWYALLYDVATSKAAVFAMKQLGPSAVAQIQSKVLLTVKEEEAVASVPSENGKLETFEELLNAHPDLFLPYRTPKALFNYWTLMKQYSLLKEQAGSTVSQPPMPVDSLENFSDIEDLIDGSDLHLNFFFRDASDPAVEDEEITVKRRHHYEMKHLENEVPKISVLVGQVTGVSLPEFDSKTLSVLKGRIVKYMIQCKEVTFGRSARDSPVDIDFSLEGPALRISRRQGRVRMDNSGDFFVLNEGKRPLYVDGRPVLTGHRHRLNNNAVLEIHMLKFTFIVNQDAIAAIKALKATS